MRRCANITSNFLRRASFLAGVSLVYLGGTPPSAWAQLTVQDDVSATNGANISQIMGATAFYNAGFTGTSAVVANIEGGLFYKYHPDLLNDSIVLDYGGPTPPPLPADPNDPTQNFLLDPNLTNDPLWTQYDVHATAVAGVIGAAPEYPGDYRAGIAYGATLVGGSVATSWDNSLSFEVTDQSFLTPYIEALQTGIPIPGQGTRLANVVNGSYGYQDASYADGGTATSGSDIYSVAFDGLARSSGATLVWSSGNGSYGGGNVNDPSAGYNGISVGATVYGDSSSPYTTVASFSSGGPSDFLAPGGTLIAGVRATVDIVAPGDAILTAYYSNATGGQTGGPVYHPAVPKNYGSFTDGTSFSAPAVAGVATLLCDVGNTMYGGGNAVNGALIKAILLNSALPTPGWDNGQTTVSGVLTTTQALDYASGAGYMDAGRAFTQYTTGTDNVSNGLSLIAPAVVSQIGWDYGYLAPTALNATPENDYYILPELSGGTVFEGTLSWFVDRTFDGLDDSSGTPTVTASDLRFTNLDLELWQVENGIPTNLVAISEAAYISTQHFYFDLPQDGEYMLRVVWAGDQYDTDNSDSAGQTYGLAWSGIAAASDAPDASTLLLVVSGGSVVALMLRKRLRS